MIDDCGVQVIISSLDCIYDNIKQTILQYTDVSRQAFKLDQSCVALAAVTVSVRMPLILNGLQLKLDSQSTKISAQRRYFLSQSQSYI